MDNTTDAREPLPFEPFEIESGIQPLPFEPYGVDSPSKQVDSASKFGWSRRFWCSCRRLCLLFATIVAVNAIFPKFLMISSDDSADAGLENSELEPDKKYAFTRLDNGLHMLAVSKENAEMVAATLCLGVGYLSDRRGLPGFLSVLVRTIIEQIDFGSMEGLSANVLPTSTCISFRSDASDFLVAAMHVVGALKRPRLHQVALSRNIEKLNRSFQMNHRRRLAVWRHDMNPAHPEHFHQGPTEKLNDPGIEEQMLNWYILHFDANDLTLAVIGPQPLSELTAGIKQLFEKLPGLLEMPPTPRGPAYVGGIPPFLPDKFAGLIYNEPVEDDTSLHLSWVLSEYSGNLWRSKPWSYACVALSWQGDGGPSAYLIHKGWILFLNAYIEDKGTYTVFDISIQLTNEGVEHILDVGAVVFEYISFLSSRSNAEVATILQDDKDMIDVRFQLRNFGYQSEKYATSHTAHELAQNMLDYPEQYVSSGPIKIFDVDPEANMKLLGELTLESARVMLTAPLWARKCTEEEPVTRSKFHKEAFQGAMRDAWDAAAQGEGETRMSLKRLIPKNPYLPVDTSLVASPSEVHDISRQAFDHLKVFSLTYVKYLEPVVYCQIRIFSSALHQEDKDEQAKSVMRAELWSLALSVQIDEKLSQLFAIGLTDYDLQVDNTWGALELTLHAPGSLMATLLERFGDMMRSSEIGTNPDSSSFVWAYHDLTKQLKFRLNAIEQSSWSFDLKQLFPDYIPPEKKLSALATFFQEGVHHVPEWLFARSSVEVLMVGNILPERAAEWSGKFVNELPLSGPALSQSAPRKALSIQRGKTFLKVPSGEPDNPNHGLAIHIQVESSLRCFDVDILSEFVQHVLINKVLTTTGHPFHWKRWDHLQNLGQHWLVLQVKTPYASELAMKVLHDELEGALTSLVKLDQAEFVEQKASFLRTIAEKPLNSLREIYTKYSKHFSSRRFTFDSEQKKRAFVQAITRTDFLNFVALSVQPARRLYLQITKTKESDVPTPRHIRDMLNKSLTTQTVLKYDQELEGIEQVADGSWYDYIDAQDYSSDLSTIT